MYNNEVTALHPFIRQLLEEQNNHSKSFERVPIHLSRGNTFLRDHQWRQSVKASPHFLVRGHHCLVHLAAIGSTSLSPFQNQIQVPIHRLLEPNLPQTNSRRRQKEVHTNHCSKPSKPQLVGDGQSPSVSIGVHDHVSVFNKNASFDMIPSFAAPPNITAVLLFAIVAA